MDSSKSIIRQHVRSIAVAGVLLISALLLVLVPALTSAAQLTNRSIQLSSSAATATNVTYNAGFTASQDAGAVVINFCSNTPLIREDCTAPAGFSVTGATAQTAGFTATTLNANTIILEGTIDVSTEDEIVAAFNGVTNPTNPGLLYARVLTYSTLSAAQGYQPATPGAYLDDGSVAISINESVQVSGAVLETVTFCVSGSAISVDCSGVVAPVLKLGEPLDDVVALTPGAVSTGNLFTQVSTNAANGLVVRLKSSATDCGGLIRAGAPTECDIQPALTGGIAEGQARFGVMVAAAADTGTSPVGVLRAVPGSNYNDTTYTLNFTEGNTAGVTSLYGDPILDTNGAPANNKNAQLTFGASIGNDTPAGNYSTSLTLIATGKF